MRKIKYKDLSADLENKMTPNNSSTRASIGMERSIAEYYFIDIDELIPFKGQARRAFNEDGINELRDSISIHGVRQPLTIKKSSEGNKYEIVSGERRFRAAKAAGVKKLPCIILKTTESPDEIGLIENLHREDLHPIEFGESCKILIAKNYAGNQAELARKLSVSPGTLSECVKLTTLPEEVKQHIMKNQIKERDKLREAIKNLDNMEELKRCVGMLPNRRLNFSVLRITNTSDGLMLQKRGINRLNNSQKDELRKKLLNIIKEITPH